MSVTTHDSKWRLLVGAAPLIGVAFFVWAAAQGEGEMARSSTARAILAAVAALGTGVAWWTAHQLRIAAALPIAQANALAQSGQLASIVALHGRARALPDAVPLVSPNGELCLWFGTGHAATHRHSVRPFLLVDDSGECVVLPADAEITGHVVVPAPEPVPVPVPVPGAAARTVAPARARRSQAPECLLRNGDRVHIAGRFVTASPESLVLQAQAASLGQHGLLLPVIAAPGSGQPLRIRMDSEDGEGGVFGMLAVADCLVLLVSSSLVAWAMLVPG